MTRFRGTGRVELDVACWVGLGDGTRLRGHLLDLGLGGCRLAVDQPLPSGEPVAVEVEDMRLVGTMSRQEPGESGWVVALQWAELPARQAARLARWIASQPRTAPFDGAS